MKVSKLFILLILAAMLLVGCEGNDQAQEVVVYTSVDQVFAEQVLTQFTADTGIEVKPVFDVEATKTTGLINRLLAEKDNPVADVFWNGEIAQMITLHTEGVLAPYSSPSASDIPDNYKAEDGSWTAFGGRARCFIINTDLLTPEEYPISILDLLNEDYPADQVAIARPLFGTTATQAAALYSYWGADNAQRFYAALIERDIQVVDGNSVVRDMVADGRLMFGLTDTDDALGAIDNGAPVAVTFPDQFEGALGTLVIPNSVALINGAPNEANGQAFIDWLLTKEQEKALIDSGWCQVAVRSVDAETPLPIDNLKTMNVTFQDIYDNLQTALDDLQELYMQ